MKRDVTDEEDQATDELIAWFEKYTSLVSHPVLVGMLTSAAAQLMTGCAEATRETFVETAGRAWDRWKHRRLTGMMPGPGGGARSMIRSKLWRKDVPS